VIHRILCEGRGFYFETGAASRPIVVTRRGQPAAQPGTRHPFWRAVALWSGQGRRLSPDGLCLWEEKRQTRERRIGVAAAGREQRSPEDAAAAAA
jgi:hypothetical protein